VAPSVHAWLEWSDRSNPSGEYRIRLDASGHDLQISRWLARAGGGRRILAGATLSPTESNDREHRRRLAVHLTLAVAVATADFSSSIQKRSSKTAQASAALNAGRRLLGAYRAMADNFNGLRPSFAWDYQERSLSTSPATSLADAPRMRAFGRPVANPRISTISSGLGASGIVTGIVSMAS
jgi:hypothetical protein